MKEKNLVEKLKVGVNKYKYIIILSVGIIVLPSLLIFYYTGNLKGYTHTDHWGNYISLLGVLIGMMGSVILFIKSKKDEEKNNRNKLIARNLDQVNIKKFDALVPIYLRIEEEKATKLTNNELTTFLSLINKINELTKLTNQV